MPRAPAKAATTAKPRAAAKDRDRKDLPAEEHVGAAAPASGEALAPLVGQVLGDLREKLPNASSDKILNVEAITKLAHAVWEAKSAAWCGQGIASLTVLGKMNAVLPELFVLLSQQEDCCDAGAAVTMVTNLEAGLLLLAMYYDAIAMPNATLVAMEEDVGNSAMPFLKRRAQPALLVACAAASPPVAARAKRSAAAAAADPQPVSAPESVALRLAKGLARVLRSAHHALAAVRYAPLSWAHHLVPVAAQCLTVGVAPDTSVGAAMVAVQDAAADLLVSMAGIAEYPLQQATMEELVTACAAPSGSTPAPALKGRGGRTRAPGPCASAAVRAVAAACLPVRLAGQDREAPREAAAQRYAAAEARASALVTELLRRTLLEGEAESPAWARLEAFVQDLLLACADPYLAAAPLLLLCLVRGLARVASSPSSAPVTWTQREFAVKMIAEALGPLSRDASSGRGEGRHAGGEDDEAKLKKWAASRRSKSNTSVLKSPEEEVLHSIITYLAEDAFKGALLPPPGAASSPLPPLEAAALPAKDPVHSCAFLLCSWTARTSPIVGAARQKKGAGASKRASKAAKGAAEDTNAGPTPEWLFQCWAGFAQAVRRKQPGESSGGGAEGDAMRACVGRILRRLWHKDGPLAHARRATLEACLTLASDSPLAHVRRQALLGLESALSADPGLLASRCVAEAIVLRLQDESPMVRFAAVQLISQLAPQKAPGPLQQRFLELRDAARPRLTDTSPMVRLAAFRIACADLRADAPTFIRDMGELLRRSADESENIRALVLKSVSMEAGADSAFSRLEGLRPDEDPRPAADLLEQVSAICPEAVHSRIEALQGWISVGASSAPSLRALAAYACRILAHALPSWAAATKAAVAQRAGRKVQDALLALLEDPELDLVRAATACFGKLATHSIVDVKELLEHFNKSLASLRHIVDRRLPLDATAQKKVCRLSWIVGSTLEFVDVDALLSDGSGPNGTPRVAEAAEWLLSTIFLKGPPAMRPCIIPCVGFLARGHPALVSRESGLYEAFRVGLTSGGPAQCHTLQALSGLFEAYSARAESAAPTLASVEGSAATASGAANCLSALQPELLAALAGGQATPPHAVAHTLSVLQGMHRLGVLHPASTLPALLGACLAGPRATAGAAQRLLLRISEASPQLLISRLADGVRAGAARLAGASPVPAADGGGGAAAAAAANAPPALGATAGQEWRFSAVCEAYSGHLDQGARGKLREKFLDTLLAEVTSLAAQGGREEPREILFRAEVAVGMLHKLPYRSEGEVCRVLRAASNFLVLKALPLLPPAPATADPSALPGLCAASVLLFVLCEHWGRHIDGPRLLQVDDACSDQPLPAGFSRRSPLDLATPLQQLDAAACSGGQGDRTEALLAVLAGTIPQGAWLLQGRGAFAPAAAVGRGRKRTSGAAAAEAPVPPPASAPDQPRGRGKRHKAAEPPPPKEAVPQGAAAAAAGA